MKSYVMKTQKLSYFRPHVFTSNSNEQFAEHIALHLGFLYQAAVTTKTCILFEYTRFIQ